MQPTGKGVKRKSSEVAPSDGDANHDPKKLKTDVQGRTTLVLQHDGSFEEANYPPASSASETAPTEAGTSSVHYTTESIMPSASAANKDQEALEPEDFHLLFGAGADNTDIDWTE